QRAGRGRQGRVRWTVRRTPVSDRRQHGDEVHAAVGEAVYGFLLMRRVVRTAEKPGLDQAVEPGGESAARDLFVRTTEQFAEMAAIGKDDVTQNKHGPPVADEFDSEI